MESCLLTKRSTPPSTYTYAHSAAGIVGGHVGRGGTRHGNLRCRKHALHAQEPPRDPRLGRNAFRAWGVSVKYEIVRRQERPIGRVWYGRRGDSAKLIAFVVHSVRVSEYRWRWGLTDDGIREVVHVLCGK